MVLKMRFEPGSSGFSTRGICGAGGSCATAGAAAATRAIAARRRFNLATESCSASADAEDSLQRLSEMVRERGFRGVWIAADGCIQDFEVLVQRRNCQWLCDEAIHADEQEIFVKAAGSGFDQRVAQRRNQSSVQPFLEHGQFRLFGGSEIVLVEMLEESGMVPHQALYLDRIAAFRQGP